MNISVVDSAEPRAIRLYLTGKGWIQEPTGAIDYTIWCRHPKPVLVQRKAGMDYVQSLNDGRVLRDCRVMAEADAMAVYLVKEGRFEKSQNGKVMVNGEYTSLDWARLEGFELSASARGIIIWQTEAMSDTATFLLHLQEYWDKPVHQAIRPTEAKGNPLFAALLEIPGVGKDVATKISSQVHSLDRLCGLSELELLYLEGVGPKRAKAVWQAIHENTA